jgi:hypothetical protein
MRRLLVPLALTALTLALFCWWVHPEVLDILNVGWTLNGKDWGPNALGLAAYLRAGSWPGSTTPLVMAPEGIHLLMMDSNPLVALLLKPFAGWLLPAQIQVIGWVMLINLALHVTFAWLLVRERAPNTGMALAGTALLALLPTLYNRFPHPNLTAHWLILWSLWLFVGRDRARRWEQWFVVVALAGLIHSYLLLMVLAFWGSAFVREVVLGGDRRGALASFAAMAGLGVALALFHGLTDTPMSTGTYGSFPMALDALWNPVVATNSAFLPASIYSPNQGFEGFQYLGAGLLLLVVAGALRGLTQRPRPDGLVWLMPALFVLTAVAVSDVVVWGDARLVHARPPQGVIDALDLVRASGRLFWPTSYVLVYAALTASMRWEKVRLLITAALVLQVADMVPMMAAIRGETARATDPAVFERTRDPRWATLIAGAGAIDIQPPEAFRDAKLLEEIGWHAMLACRPMRFMYVSRVSRAATARLAAERRDFLAGKVPADRLVVLYPGERVPDPLRPRRWVLDGVSVVIPVAPASPPSCSSSPRSAS